MITVLVVDDHPVVRQGITAVLDAEPDIEVVGSRSRCDEIVAAVADLRPDVVLLDLRLADGESLDACGALQSLDVVTRVVMFTQTRNERVLMRALEVKVAGFVVKRSNLDVVREAVRCVGAGNCYIDPEIAASVAELATRARRKRHPYGLTQAELQVASHLTEGLTNAEIGAHLGVSAETVKTHLSAAMQKTATGDRTELAAKLAREELI